MQTIGDYDDDSSARTLFGLIRQLVGYCTAIKSNTEALIGQMTDFQTAVTGQINTLETSVTGQINTLSAKVDKCHNDELTAISTIYRVSASNAFSASQVKSTKAGAVSPKQVKLTWNCTQDNDCSISSASSNALSNWTDIKAFNIYYGTTANAAKMTYYGTVNKNDSKLFYQNYEYTVSGLEPNTTYYFWVTSVMSDGMELEDSSAVRTVTTPTLASAQAKNLKYEIKSGTSLKLTWEGAYSEYVTYRVYCSTSGFTATSSTSYKGSTTSQSYTLTELTAGTQYYLAVCAVVNDGSVWVGNTSSGASNYCGAVTQVDFDACSWSEIHGFLQAGQAVDLGWKEGDSKDGWIIVEINNDRLKIWNKSVKISPYTNPTVQTVRDPNTEASKYYTQFNADVGITMAESSGNFSIDDCSSGWLSVAANRAASCFYYLANFDINGGQYKVSPGHGAYSPNNVWITITQPGDYYTGVYANEVSYCCTWTVQSYTRKDPAVIPYVIIK